MSVIGSLEAPVAEGRMVGEINAELEMPWLEGRV